MPLKILPKKSWHVLSRDNIARVKKDEAEARALEAEKAERAALAEQEARTSLLRSRAQLMKGGEDQSGSGERSVLQGDRGREEHMNLFGQTSRAHNLDTERERKEEREHAEQRMGVLTYLAQSTLGKDKRASEPWYTSKQGETEAASERQKQKKHSMDPLQVMQEARKRMHSHTQPAAVSSLSYITDIPHQSAGACTAEEGMAEEPRTKRHKGSKEKHKKQWKHSKHRQHKSHKKHKSSPVIAVVPSGGLSTEEMRQERLKREKEEQKRTEALLRRAALAET